MATARNVYKKYSKSVTENSETASSFTVSNNAVVTTSNTKPTKTGNGFTWSNASSITCNMGSVGSQYDQTSSQYVALSTDKGTYYYYCSSGWNFSNQSRDNSWLWEPKSGSATKYTIATGKGILYGYVSTAGSYSDTDEFIFELQGSDYIDAYSITLPATFAAGGTTKATVTPSKQNVYGGDISYQYQVSYDGGTTWEDVDQPTTELTKQISVPSGTTTLKARVQASDGWGFTSETYTEVETASNVVTTIIARFNPALETPSRITSAIEYLSGIFPDGCTVTCKACNNGFDATPTWEDVTSAVLAGTAFSLSNTTKTADKWGYNFQVTIEKGTATAACKFTGSSGYFIS